TPNPSVSGQTATLAATVTPSTALGTVEFFDGAALLGTASLSGGTAMLSVASLAVGTHALSAIYGGNLQRSTSPVLTQVVNRIWTSTSIGSIANPQLLTQPVSLT